VSQAPFITTSWDDGHPLDLRLAELLAKYGLPGTFYVPRTAETTTMSPSELRSLGSTFEIGAHTLHHVNLSGTSQDQARLEVTESKAWVEEVVGAPCRMFCPPKGKFSRRHLEMIREAGYVGMRTVELLSLDVPRVSDGLRVMPTTVQAHPFSRLGYGRNVIRRCACRNLWTLLTHNLSKDWMTLARSLLRRVLERGGVFHLWGHSWELEQTGQWQHLDEVLRLLSDHMDRAAAFTNGQLCEAVAAPAEALR
jgi:hypothetical protein